MLSVTFKLSNSLNTLLLRAQFLITQLLHAKLNGVLLDSVNLLDSSLVLLYFIDDFTVKSSPKFVKLWQNLQFLAILIQSKYLVKHSIGAVNVRLHKLLVLVLVIIAFLFLLVIGLLVLVFADVQCLLPERFINQDIVQVLQFLQSKDSLELVALLTLVARIGIGIVLHVQHLQVVLLLQVFQVLDG